MVGNFGKRLKPYDMTVKELTGDMNLSRAEIEDAQVRTSGIDHMYERAGALHLHALYNTLLYCLRDLDGAWILTGIDCFPTADDRCDTREVGYHHPQEW